MSGLDKEQILSIKEAAKHEIRYGFKALQKNPYSLWNSYPDKPLFLNCLPASVSALRAATLQEAFPKAKLVIGYVQRKQDNTSGDEKEASIHEFMALSSYSGAHVVGGNYHAWIDLDGASYLDITGPNYIEKADANGESFYYESHDHEVFKNFHPVLVGDQAEVFFKKMTEARTLNWFGDSQYVVPLEQEPKSCLSKLLDKLKN
ncbi:hypothetical protein ACPV47_16220 [Vibrio jasicida]|uniref:hypothetical protein n=1 Tax=Vibrio jasicida TaxID=766224 RepID=UPI0040687A9E